MKAQNVLILISLILFLNLSFAIDVASTNTRALFITDCFDENGIVNENCLKYALPMNISDCNLIPQTIQNYESLLTKCYAYERSCNALTLDQTYKDICFDQSNACEKIIDLNKKNSCTTRVNNENFNLQIRSIFIFILLALFLLSPLTIIIIIIKTLFDIIKKNKFSLVKRIILIILIMFFWTIIAMFPWFVIY